MTGARCVIAGDAGSVAPETAARGDCEVCEGYQGGGSGVLVRGVKRFEIGNLKLENGEGQYKPSLAGNPYNQEPISEGEFKTISISVIDIEQLRRWHPQKILRSSTSKFAATREVSD
jgi:hypothetical protein